MLVETAFLAPCATHTARVSADFKKRDLLMTILLNENGIFFFSE